MYHQPSNRNPAEPAYNPALFLAPNGYGGWRASGHNGAEQWMVMGDDAMLVDTRENR